MFQIGSAINECDLGRFKIQLNAIDIEPRRFADRESLIEQAAQTLEQDDVLFMQRDRSFAEQYSSVFGAYLGDQT